MQDPHLHFIPHTYILRSGFVPPSGPYKDHISVAQDVHNDEWIKEVSLNNLNNLKCSSYYLHIKDFIYIHTHTHRGCICILSQYWSSRKVNSLFHSLHGFTSLIHEWMMPFQGPWETLEKLSLWSKKIKFIFLCNFIQI